MDKDTTKATEAQTENIAAQQGGNTIITPTQDDLEAKNAALEAEKARLIEEAANYKMAYLKAKSRNGGSDAEEETEDDRVKRIVAEQLSESRLAQINSEQESLLRKALKENNELKLAQLSKTGTPPAATGTHSESAAVQDTLVTPEQMTAFKNRGWTDKDIERYKKNLGRYR